MNLNYKPFSFFHFSFWIFSFCAFYLVHYCHLNLHLYLLIFSSFASYLLQIHLPTFLA